MYLLKWIESGTNYFLWTGMNCHMPKLILQNCLPRFLFHCSYLFQYRMYMSQTVWQFW